MVSHIQQYEFLHGCVLTALMRSERPSTVRLVETDTNSAWSMYKVNDAYIHVKPSAAPRVQKSSTAWQFTFTKNELQKIKEKQSYVVLVCADRDIKTKMKMWRLLIDFNDFVTLVNLEDIPDQDSVSAKYIDGNRKLLVAGGNNEIKVAPKALLDWQVPGG